MAVNAWERNRDDESHAACPNITIILFNVCQTQRSALETWKHSKEEWEPQPTIKSYQSFSSPWWCSASSTDSLLAKQMCIQRWLLWQMHIHPCVQVHRSACWLNRWRPKQHLASSSEVVRVPAFVRVWAWHQCVYTLWQMWVAVCLFPDRRWGISQPSTKPLLSHFAQICWLYDVTLGDKVTSSIIFCTRAAISYRLE